MRRCVERHLRDADELMRPAVDETIRALGLEDIDAAAIKLAQKYADAIDSARDQAWAMRWIGPLLLQCLESLGATPVARGKTKNPTIHITESKLHALRNARPS